MISDDVRLALANKVSEIFKEYSDGYWRNMDDDSFCDVLDEHVDRVKHFGKESDTLFGVTDDDRLKLFVYICSRSFDCDRDATTFAIEFLSMYDDFLVAPASSAFHGDWRGGLFDHSVAVIISCIRSKAAYMYSTNRNLDLLPPLLHDLCKCKCYELVNKNVKNPDTQKWETKLSYQTRKDYESIHHGPESLKRIMDLMIYFAKHMRDAEDISRVFNCMAFQFDEGWKEAVAYHMGLFGVNQDFELQNYQNACIRYPQVLMLHNADMIASKLMKV